MTKRTAAIAALILSSYAATACEATYTGVQARVAHLQVARKAPTRPSEPTLDPRFVIVPEDYGHRFNADHGDVLVFVMTPDGDMLARCDHYGGEMTYNTRTTITLCEDVDF